MAAALLDLSTDTLFLLAVLPIQSASASCVKVLPGRRCQYRAVSSTLYIYSGDSFSCIINWANTNLAAASLSALDFLPLRRYKWIPCLALTFCNHPWEYTLMLQVQIFVEDFCLCYHLRGTLPLRHWMKAPFKSLLFASLSVLPTSMFLLSLTVEFKSLNPLIIQWCSVYIEPALTPWSSFLNKSTFCCTDIVCASCLH